MIRPSAIVLCLLLSAAAPAASQEEAGTLKKRIETETQSRETLKQEIEKTRREIDRLQTRAGQATESITLAQRRLNLTQRYVKRVRGDISLTEARIDSVETQIERLGLQISVGTDRLHRRIRQIYKLGRAGILELLASSRSLNDAYSRYKYLSLIALADRQLVSEIKSDRFDLLTARDDLTVLKAANEGLLGEKEAETRRLEREERQHRQLLYRVKTRRKEHLAALEEKEDALKALDGLIAELERKRQAALEEAKRRRAAIPPPASEFEKLAGRLNWPVRGQIVSRFGIKKHPRFGTVIVNRGIDIAAPMGSDVRAVETGTVVVAQWFLTFGMMVLLDHGGGYYTIYSHLADVYVSFGARVGSGNIIGTVGDTGSLEGPMLHFEILQGQQPVDPLQWLRPL